MIIPGSVTVMIYGLFIGITGLYFGLNYLGDCIDKWLEGDE